MIRVMFVCLGNICRSPMAEFVFKDMIEKRGISDKFFVASAATSDEAVGCTMYPKAQRLMDSLGIATTDRRSVQLARDDFDKYDYIMGMENTNIRDIRKIFGCGNSTKVKRLLEFTADPHDIADPWYTQDFETTYKEICEGCEGFLAMLEAQGAI